MKKFGAVAIIVALMIGAYLFMMIAMPIISDFASTANTTMSASSNMSDYPGTLDATLAIPWIMWFVPAVIGMIIIIIILKQP